MWTDACPDHPYFPGEPPAESFFLGLEGLGLLILAIAVVTRVQPTFMKASRMAAKVACALILLGLLFLVPVLMRRTGEWRALQHAIQARQTALDQVRLAHPTWTSRQLVDEFREQNSLPWEFHFKDPQVKPVYFKVSDWRAGAPRIVVAYNDCNNALFDPDSMWVEASD